MLPETNDEAAAWVWHAPRLMRWLPSCPRAEAHVADYLVALGAVTDVAAAQEVVAAASGVAVYLDRVAPDDIQWLRTLQPDLTVVHSRATETAEVVLLAPQPTMQRLVATAGATATANSSLGIALRLLFERAALHTFTLRTTPALTLTRGEPVCMGIVNVTPDSFSDGGRHVAPPAAVAHALSLVEQGARILDVGGESTRPGAQPVDAEEEAARILPVIAELAKRLHDTVPISVDTMKPAVARRALEAGASLINDVGGFRDPEMIALVAQHQVPVCCMHMQGQPRTMQQAPQYKRDVVAEVDAFLRERTAALITEAGLEREQVVLDPGFGFGKTHTHNFTLLRRLDELTTLGQPVLAGLSRKSSLAAVSDNAPAQERLPESLAAHLLAAQQGATILRVHDVQETQKVLAILRAQQ